MSRPTSALVLAPFLGALLAGCAAPGPAPGGAADSRSSTSAPVPSAAPTAEAQGPSPRLAVSHRDGVMVVDAATLEVVGGAATTGFVRLNPAGDGRHVLVTQDDGWRVLDLGAWTEPHGDHGHSFTTTPRLTGTTIRGPHPGHVVVHGTRTTLFADGTGEMQVLDPDSLGAVDGSVDVVRHRAPAAHHGVAVTLPDGTLVHSLGTEEARTGAVALDVAGAEVARTDDCPGLHGEAVAAGDVVTLGCENGILVYRDGRFTKVASPTAYGRIGNQAGSERSGVVLGDYKVDEDAELERPTRISLVDTRTGRLRLVETGASYSFRSLERGPAGEALVLGTDGRLRVVDPDTGVVTRSVPVVGPWREPVQWQDPRPAVRVVGDRAYVTEPSRSRLVAVDLTTGRLAGEATLPHVPNEIAGVAG
ncbi:zinc metallochaperone AztD [Terrabacter sp. NPDC000476]|uniref:zinc metallochaperone AztD n=1 Tax=Terrabacter sp. NPDC000476 TaxID=3154258 RepID=UPI00332A7188